MRRFLWGVGFFLFLIAGSLALEMWVAGQIEKRLEIKISGVWIPVPFLNRIYFKNADVVWKDKVELISADIKVSYQYNFIFGRRIRLNLQNQSPVKVRFLGVWSKMQGREEVTLGELMADVALDPKGLAEIYELHAESPAFQFHINQSEK